MNDTYTFGDMACVSAFTFIVAFFLGCWLMDTYNVKPLQREAIKRGYATFTISNTNKETMSEFTWK